MSLTILSAVFAAYYIYFLDAIGSHLVADINESFHCAVAITTKGLTVGWRQVSCLVESMWMSFLSFHFKTRTPFLLVIGAETTTLK